MSWRATDRETDHIATVDGLVRWAADSGLIAGDVDVPAHALDTAHALRKAIRTVMEAALAQEEDPGEAAVLLEVFRECLGSANFDGTPARLLFRAPATEILGPIALAAVDLLRSDRLMRVKMCPQDDCHWLFLDMTKNGSRRWCDMASCGNRVKVAHFRKRGTVSQTPH